jgi:Fur family zinc uptake transcriptional regulator
MGAYEILDQLASDGFGSKPPVVYRALEFLINSGLTHKIERLNAYVACTHPSPDQAHIPAFLICRACRAVSESEARMANGHLETAAQKAGFSIERTAVEAEGLCPACQTEAPSND